MPTIAHLDLDAFYVSVEVLRRPELRGRPVVVSGTGPRAVVTTASYEARRYGVGSAMPAARARRLCPEAAFIPPDFELYRRESARVMALLHAHVERVEVMGLDEAYLDLSGLLSPKATMRRLVTEIHAATGLSASVGIGPSKLVAKVCSDLEKPRGFVVMTREEACARFATAAPRVIPGIGPRTAERLEALGIGTVGALAAAPEADLAAAFGSRHGPWLRRRAHFEDGSAVCAAREAVSESRERTFDADVADRAEQQRILAGLVEALCEDLARHERRGRTVAIKVRLDDFTTVTRARTLPEAVGDAGRIGAVARDLLDEYDPPRPVRLLGVRLASLEHGEPARAPDPAGAAQLALPL